MEEEQGSGHDGGHNLISDWDFNWRIRKTISK